MAAATSNINPTNDTLGSSQAAGFSTAWSFKDQYVAGLADDNLERFSQYSATPDSTMLFAGPARFNGLAGNTAVLTPIGLTDGVAIQQSPQLQRLYEIGSNRAYFTRGKTICSVSFSRVLADQSNILKALSANAYRPITSTPGASTASAATPNPNIGMNLDSEEYACPFGLMLLFKTRGGGTEGSNGKLLASIYLEYCMFSNYSFQIANQSPVIMEGLSIEYDRVVPVAMTN